MDAFSDSVLGTQYSRTSANTVRSLSTYGSKNCFSRSRSRMISAVFWATISVSSGEGKVPERMIAMVIGVDKVEDWFVGYLPHGALDQPAHRSIDVRVDHE